MVTVRLAPQRDLFGSWTVNRAVTVTNVVGIPPFAG